MPIEQIIKLVQKQLVKLHDTDKLNLSAQYAVLQSRNVKLGEKGRRYVRK